MVLLSRPYDAQGDASDTWEARPLLADGALGPAMPFAMGRAVRVLGHDPLVLVAENIAVRRFRFVAGGAVDLGVTATGNGVAGIVGAIGV